MRRREFVLIGTAAAATIPVRSADRIRIAFIGGQHSHAAGKAKAVQESQDWDFVGVVEDDPAVAARFEKMGIRRISREAALKDDSIPVIAVESAVKDHESDAIQVLRANKHVHIEKPIAHTREGMNAIASEARERNRLVQSGYMWRYNPGFQKVIEAAKNGWLGDVYMVRGMMNTLISANRRPGWAEFKGGQMFEMGGHLIDPMLRILGKPSHVQSVLRKHGKYDDSLLDNTVAILEFPHALAIVQSSTLQPGAGRHRTFEVQGTNGTAVIGPLEQPVLEIDLAKAAGPYKAGVQRVELPSYQRYVDDFVELAAVIRGTGKLVVPLEHEIAVNDVLLRASNMG